MSTRMPMNRMRIRAIHSETGAVTSVNYADTECSDGNVPANEYGSTMRCYPVHWKFEGSGDPQLHRFHKHVVDSVVESDRTAGGVAVETHYSYGGDPGWAYNDDEFTKEEHRTWNQWRGYSRVTTRVGNPAAEQLRTESLYLRGLHGDEDGQGGTRSVSVTDSFGDSVTDHEQFAGMLREQRTFNGDDVVSSTINDRGVPLRPPTTATPRPGS